MHATTTPRNLLLRLALYFAVMIGSVSIAGAVDPDALRWLPIGGMDAIEIAELEVETRTTIGRSGSEVVESRPIVPRTGKKVWLVFFVLGICLVSTLLLILPVAWTYTATRHSVGYPKTFAHMLFGLPICTTAIVLLIQGSLALAFGLAALVAAVRFRVRLPEPVDGIYIFAAICVGLAAGIGYLGVAAIMAIFFCFTNAILWSIEYGKNPLDEARAERDRDKLLRRSAGD